MVDGKGREEMYLACERLTKAPRTSCDHAHFLILVLIQAVKSTVVTHSDGFLFASVCMQLPSNHAELALEGCPSSVAASVRLMISMRMEDIALEKNVDKVNISLSSDSCEHR